MYTIEKRQLAYSIGDGMVEICPDGVVSADNCRIMIVPHAVEPEETEVIHIGAEQAGQIAREFFKGQDGVAMQGNAMVATFMMESEYLNLDKTVCARAPENMEMPDWHTYIDMFKSGRKALFDLDLLLDTLQRLKKAAGEKNLCAEIDIGQTSLTKISVVPREDFPDMRPLPYAYIMQCKKENDNDAE